MLPDNPQKENAEPLLSTCTLDCSTIGINMGVEVSHCGFPAKSPETAIAGLGYDFILFDNRSVMCSPPVDEGSGSELTWRQTNVDSWPINKLFGWAGIISNITYNFFYHERMLH